MNQGSCKHCGQYIELEFDENTDRITLDKKAELLCECPEARQTQKRFREEADAVQRREKTLRESKKTIKIMFGRIDEEDEKAVMPESAIEFINSAAVLVYDSVISKINIDLPHGAKAKLSKSAKGNLKIAREDKESEAVEI